MYSVDLHCDIEFTKSEKNLIISACKRWNNFTKNYINFNPIFNLDKFNIDMQINFEFMIFKVYSDFYFIKENEIKYKSSIVGFCDITDINQKIIYIVYDKLKNNNKFESVVMHELGHAIGLDHIDDEGIMFFQTGCSYFTFNDAKELYRIYPKIINI